MNHQAVYNTHPIVKRIQDTEGGVVAYDAEGNTVTLDADAVASETIVVVNAQNLARLRAQRNELLAATDWEIVKHKELGTNIPTALKTYRQQLRDLPANTSDPANPSWPIKP